MSDTPPARPPHPEIEPGRMPQPELDPGGAPDEIPPLEMPDQTEPDRS